MTHTQNINTKDSNKYDHDNTTHTKTTEGNTHIREQCKYKAHKEKNKHKRHSNKYNHATAHYTHKSTTEGKYTHERQQQI